MTTEPVVSDESEQIPELAWVPSMQDIYMIIYKEASNLVTRYFAFNHEGDRNDPKYWKEAKFAAIQRAQLYCTRMRYRFVHCQPFLEDLDWREKHISLI